MRVVQDWISPFTWMPSPTMRVPSEWDSSWGTFGSAFERPRTPAPGRTPRPSSDAGTRRRGWLVVVMAAFVLPRSEEHTSELQSLMRISYAVFCLTKNIEQNPNDRTEYNNK